MLRLELLTRSNNKGRSGFGNVYVVSEPCERQYGNEEVQDSYLKPGTQASTPIDKHDCGNDNRRNTDDAEPEQQFSR